MRLIAKRLGVDLRETIVTPSTRIEKLLKGEINLVLATMNHTTVRDKITTFIQPHYYSSPSSIFGPARLPVSVLTDSLATCSPESKTNLIQVIPSLLNSASKPSYTQNIPEAAITAEPDHKVMF